MAKFARFDIIWQGGAFFDCVLDAEHRCTVYFNLILLPKEKVSTTVCCFAEHLSDECVFRVP